MKTQIRFNRAYVPAAVLSAALIILSVVGFFTKGLNLGVDFEAGLIQEIRVTEPIAALTYKGPASVSVSLGKTALTIVVSGVGADNVTHTLPFDVYGDAASLAEAINELDGVQAELLTDGAKNALSERLFVDSEKLSRLSAEPYPLYYVADNAPVVPVADVRAALAHIEGVSVQNIGDEKNRAFQIRAADDGSDPQSSLSLRASVSQALADAFGADNIAVVKTDFVGAQYSKSLATQVLFLIAATLVLIAVYVTIRFRWDMALGAIIALIHDSIITLGFIIWSGMEFNTMIIAALLTILGYSVNDTIVVFDRVRENIKILGEKDYTSLLNTSINETLSRTILTTVTTLLAVVSLFIFTTGSMRNFALALIVGMISGTYSTIFIATSFTNLISGRGVKNGGAAKTNELSANAVV